MDREAMLEDPQWLGLSDPVTGQWFYLRFRLTHRLKDAICPNPLCGRVGTTLIGETADGNERFAVCYRCEWGRRHLTLSDIC